MNRIDNLVMELCPEGVSHIPVTAVADYIRGVTYSKGDEQDDGTIQILRANNITLSSNTLNFDDVKRVADSVRVRDDQRLRPGDILMCAGSGSMAHIGKVAYVSESLPYTFGGFMAVVRTKSQLLPRFLFHLLTGRKFLQYLEGALATSTINNLNARLLNAFRVPVPPLGVQREIVRILDKFTELEARQKQYEYYRTELLAPASQATTVLSLGDVFEMRAGSHVRAANISNIATEETPYPCFGGNGIRGYVSQYSHNEAVLFIGRQGALCGNVHRSFGKAYATEHAVVVTPKIEVDMAWAFHLLTHMNLNQYKTKSAQPGLAVGKLKNLRIALPPLQEQQRVGDILDKFDTLVSGVSSGLPAEISARRKQYEYYRDKLLTFKELRA